jgi:hypothetical protein
VRTLSSDPSLPLLLPPLFLQTLGPASDLDWHLSHVDFPASARDGLGPIITPTGAPALHHLCIDPRVRVFEPLWTILPSSKAILPILCTIAPRHPFLLRSSLSGGAKMRPH